MMCEFKECHDDDDDADCQLKPATYSSTAGKVVNGSKETIKPVLMPVVVVVAPLGNIHHYKGFSSHSSQKSDVVFCAIIVSKSPLLIE